MPAARRTVAELGAGEPAAAGEGRREGGLGPRDDRRVELEVPQPAGDAGADPRGRQRQQPADVAGEDEVPGRAQHVGAQDGAVVEQPVHRGGGGVAGALARPPRWPPGSPGTARRPASPPPRRPRREVPRRDAGCAAVGSRCPLAKPPSNGAGSRLAPAAARRSSSPGTRRVREPSGRSPAGLPTERHGPGAARPAGPGRRARAGPVRRHACTCARAERPAAPGRRGRGRSTPPPQRPPGRHPARRDPGRAGGRAAPRAGGGRPGQDQAAPRSSRRRGQPGPGPPARRDRRRARPPG